MPASVKDRPAFVAVEARLTAPQADALEAWLVQSAKLLRSGVIVSREANLDDAAAAIEKLLAALRLRMEPFDLEGA